MKRERVRKKKGPREKSDMISNWNGGKTLRKTDRKKGGKRPVVKKRKRPV